MKINVFKKHSRGRSTAAPRQCSLRSPETVLIRERVNQREQHYIAAADIHTWVSGDLIPCLHQTFCQALAKSHQFSVWSSTDFIWTGKCQTVCTSLLFLQPFCTIGMSQKADVRQLMWWPSVSWAMVWWYIALRSCTVLTHPHRPSEALPAAQHTPPAPLCC